MTRFLPARWFYRDDAEILPMQRQMNRMFKDFFGNAPAAKAEQFNGWAPSIDVAETEDDVIVKAEVPGVDPTELEITILGDVLTIKGEKKEEKEEKGKDFHYVESRYGSFSRSVQLPSTVEAGKVKAEAKDGIMTITLPKKEEDKVKSIQVKVN